MKAINSCPSTARGLEHRVIAISNFHLPYLDLVKLYRVKDSCP